MRGSRRVSVSVAGLADGTSRTSGERAAAQETVSDSEESSSSEIRDKDKTYHFQKFLENDDLAQPIVEVSL